jgi:hypothetical protein
MYNPAVEKDGLTVAHNSTEIWLQEDPIFLCEFCIHQTLIINLSWDLISKNERHWPVNRNILVLVASIYKTVRSNIACQLSAQLRSFWPQLSYSPCASTFKGIGCLSSTLSILPQGSIPASVWNSLPTSHLCKYIPCLDVSDDRQTLESNTHILSTWL